MKINKQKKIKDIDKYSHTKIDCYVSKASNEIMLNRINGGKDNEFPFCTLNKE